MIRKYLIFILILFFFKSTAFGAASDGQGTISKKKHNQNPYTLAEETIKRAKKLEKKNKINKAKKNYEKALKYLLKSNADFPAQADTLNLLGFTHRKIGDFENAEIYYELGLLLEPNHFGINEYLGELYVQTNRIEKAKERLKVLQNCNCKEFKELKNAINSGKSKY
jgi:tetratricopeptide (TPR) repeat protein